MLYSHAALHPETLRLIPPVAGPASVPRERVLSAARQFAARLAAADRGFRRASVSVPDRAAREQVAADFWELMQVIESAVRGWPEHELGALKAEVQRIVGPWVWRSRFMNRSKFKPHGYSGDVFMIEWTYEAEAGAGEDPFQPAIVNCLDHVVTTFHSVQSLWERRHWLASLLAAERRRLPGRMRVLDLACGGARYLRDFLEAAEEVRGVELTLFDQDPAAIAYIERSAFARWPEQVRTICAPVRKLAALLGDARFDVILSAGLFDYLDDGQSRLLLQVLAEYLEPGGLLAISNFDPSDGSALAKDWMGDWQLLFRDEAGVAALFPAGLEVRTSLSRNGSLVYATGRRGPA